MQISKNFMVVCTAVGCASYISFAGQDTPAQAQAREALREKIAELNAQGSTAETAPKPPKLQKPAPVAAPPPAVQPPAVTLTPPPQPVAPAPVVAAPVAPAASPATSIVAPRATPLPPRMSNEEAERLREALRTKIAELNAQEAAGQPAPAPMVSEPIKTPAVADESGNQRATVAEKQRQAEAARAQAEAEKRAAAAAAKSAAKKPEPKVQAAATATGMFSSLQPPPSAVSGEKEAKLADLLRQYKSDAITPEQYHTQRAKILAEP